ncbi:MAG: nucleotidyltransferase [Lachnospiraceae bacterium]|nr:nucleotidyltransferase [Lachnospiraceae bacterium]
MVINMKVLGIITEYNPFHKGHQYHIEEAKRITGADYVIAVMSGDFMQRGIPAIIDKYTRTEMALSCGVDLVLELPVCYSTSSAEYFASSSIAILDKLGIISSICFGSECADISILKQIASVLIEEPKEYKECLLTLLKQGYNYPLARNRALDLFFHNQKEELDVLNSPNNILGIEYIKALLRRNSSIVPATIKRVGSDYHSKDLSHVFASALSIRKAMQAGQDLSIIKEQVPNYVYQILEKEVFNTFPVFRNDFSALLQYKILINQKDGFASFSDVTSDLSDRILNQSDNYTTYSEFCDLLKTKEITYSRISRMLLHILLDMKSDCLLNYVQHDYLNYARILGFRKNASDLLTAIKKNSSLTLLSKTADAKKLLSPLDYSIFEETIMASHIYQSVAAKKFNRPMKNEYTQQIIISNS